MAGKYVTLDNLNDNLKDYTKEIIKPLLDKVGVRKPIEVSELPAASEDTLYASYIVPAPEGQDGTTEWITVEYKDGDATKYKWIEIGTETDETDTIDWSAWTEDEKAGK